MKFHAHDIKSALKKWLPLGFSVTTVFLFGYIAVQQDIRMGANDTQAEIAAGVDTALMAGTPSAVLGGTSPVEIERSLAPYVLIYDMDGKPLAGSGTIGGAFPVPPKGVFSYLLAHKEDRFTWEPKLGVRQAVVARFHDGTAPAYIFVGRSLTEVERHIDQLSLLTLLLWIGTMVGSLTLTVVLD